MADAPAAPDAVVLFGVSGSGKSTLGRRLAAAYGATFLEGDDFHPPANVAKMRAGRPLEDEDRWPWLLAIGAAMAREVAAGRRVVVACSALRRAYRARLRDALGAAGAAIFVELDAPADDLAPRIANRPRHFMPASLLASQLATLEPLQPDEPGFRVPTSADVSATLAAIMRQLPPP